jgi:GNAT superfamily N-acetyltransferase
LNDDRPELRRKGKGTQLIKEVEKCAKDINASYIYSYMYGQVNPP